MQKILLALALTMIACCCVLLLGTARGDVVHWAQEAYWGGGDWRDVTDNTGEGLLQGEGGTRTGVICVDTGAWIEWRAFASGPTAQLGFVFVWIPGTEFVFAQEMDSFYEQVNVTGNGVVSETYVVQAQLGVVGRWRLIGIFALDDSGKVRVIGSANQSAVCAMRWVPLADGLAVDIVNPLPLPVVDSALVAAIAGLSETTTPPAALNNTGNITDSRLQAIGQTQIDNAKARGAGTTAPARLTDAGTALAGGLVGKPIAYPAVNIALGTMVFQGHTLITAEQGQGASTILADSTAVTTLCALIRSVLGALTLLGTVVYTFRCGLDIFGAAPKPGDTAQAEVVEA